MRSSGWSRALAALVVAGCGSSDVVDSPSDASAPEAGDATTTDATIAEASSDTGAADGGADAVDAAAPDARDAAVDGGVDDASADADGSDSADGALDAAGDAPTDSGQDGATDGGACNALVDTAPLVPAILLPGSPPTPQGGTVADGTYYLTTWYYYSGTDAGGPDAGTGDTQRGMFVLTGSALDYIGWTSARGTEVAATYSATPAGVSFPWIESCPFTGTTPWSYTSSGSVLHIFLGSAELVFDKQ